MAKTPSNRDELVTLAFAIEILVVRPTENVDFDPVAFGGEVVRDAISGWGVPVRRVVHIPKPEDVFAG